MKRRNFLRAHEITALDISIFSCKTYVKAVLSEHVHPADRTEHSGVHDRCNYLACGSWRKGNNREFGPAYGIINFYADRTNNTSFN
ncbi:hypothetical protein SLH46_05470 [Draconibacterium sp. IB214405]|uniref:hypothetical protein n=1 Tax=Draconibacterium sp. IB214405 TaxID=3097352 RepID=UPI002A0BD35E|nr:hypothetical protein [Draconibacterium sp. IB214405]MDX8338620.1 hypothetical protein [Draconibacterium sp. IB214405]